MLTFNDLKRLVKLANDLDEKGKAEEADKIDSIILDSTSEEKEGFSEEQLKLLYQADKWNNFTDSMMSDDFYPKGSEFPDYSYRSVFNELNKELPKLLAILPYNRPISAWTNTPQIMEFWRNHLRGSDDPAALVRELASAEGVYQKEITKRLLGIKPQHNLSSSEVAELTKDVYLEYASDDEVVDLILHFMPELSKEEASKRFENFTFEAGSLKEEINQLRDLYTRKRRYR